MNIDAQTLVNIALSAVMAVAGWLGSEVYNAVKKLKEDVHQIEVDLPTIYLRRDEFSDGMKEIRDLFGKVFDRLDRKADK